MTARSPSTAKTESALAIGHDRLANIADDELRQARERASRALSRLDRAIPAHVEPAHVFIVGWPRCTG